MGDAPDKNMSAARLVYLVCLTVPVCLSASVRQADRDVACPMQGLDCVFNNIERANNVGSWQECAVQCSNHRTCAYWSWHIPDALNDPYGCWLKTGCGFTLPDTKVISGSYTCTSK